MIDLYYYTSQNVRKVLIALEELSLEYQIIWTDIKEGDQFAPESLEINPNGKVPAIVDHDGPGGEPIAIFETGAILQYLAEKTGRLLPTRFAGNSSGEPASCGTLRRMSSTCGDSGNRCSWPVLVSADDNRQLAALRSSWSQRIAATSPRRCAVRSSSCWMVPKG